MPICDENMDVKLGKEVMETFFREKQIDTQIFNILYVEIWRTLWQECGIIRQEIELSTYFAEKKSTSWEMKTWEMKND
jgi:hypothetical protein